MNAVTAVVALLLHAALLIAAAPLATGLLHWMTARLTGQASASPLQPWRDLRRLVRKQAVMAEGASSLTLGAPLLAFTAVTVAALLVPSFTLGMASADAADLIVLAGLLALARGLMALAGMDAGTSVGGMGASRLLRPALLAEPALLLVVLVFALLTGGTNIDTVALTVREGGLGAPVAAVLVLPAAVIVALVQAGRLPGTLFPAGELSMTQDAVAQDYAGWQLALIEATSSLRLLLWLCLLGVLFFPYGIGVPALGLVGWLLGLMVWAAKMLTLLAGLALFEAQRAGMRQAAVAEWLAAAVLLGLAAAVLVFAGQGGV